MKRIFAFAAALIITAAVLSGCGDKKLIDEELIQTVTVDEASALHYSASPDRLPDISFSEQFGDDADYPLWVWCEHDMNNAALIRLSYSETDDKPAVGETIYPFGNVVTGKGIVLYIEPEEAQPTVGLTYLSGDRQYVFALTMDENSRIPALAEIIQP